MMNEYVMNELAFVECTADKNFGLEGI